MLEVVDAVAYAIQMYERFTDGDTLLRRMEQAVQDGNHDGWMEAKAGAAPVIGRVKGQLHQSCLQSEPCCRACWRGLCILGALKLYHGARVDDSSPTVNVASLLVALPNMAKAAEGGGEAIS